MVQDIPVADLPEVVEVVTVQVDRSKMLIGDIALMARLGEIKGQNVPTDLLGPMIEMLDRVVVGGVAQRPLDDLANVMRAFGAAMQDAGNPKN